MQFFGLPIFQKMASFPLKGQTEIMSSNDLCMFSMTSSKCKFELITLRKSLLGKIVDIK